MASRVPFETRKYNRLHRESHTDNDISVSWTRERGMCQ